MNLPRTALIEHILGRPEPIVVLDAPAGMGKSVLLAQLGVRLGRPVTVGAAAPSPGDGVSLWDIPPGADAVALPEGFVAGQGRLVVARRPDTDLGGLGRAVAYGRAAVLGADALRLTLSELTAHFPAAQARRLLASTGGWPLLLRFADGVRDPRQLAELLEHDVLRSLSTPAFAALGAVLAGRDVDPGALAALAPLVQRAEEGPARLATAGLFEPLSQAHSADFRRRCADPAEAGLLAGALLAQGRTTEAITTLQRAGLHDAARDLLVEAKAHFYLYFHGSAAFDLVLAGFPLDYALREESLVICYAMQALKRGDVARARQLVSDFFGPTANDQAAVFVNVADYSLRFRFFRLLMLIYEDVYITDELFERMVGFLGELPGDAHLERGCFYNSLLEFYIRRRRFAEAEDVALRAREHFRAANGPMLQFYISLDRAVMRLMQADVTQARQFAGDAAADLAAAGFETPNDSRLLTLLMACVDYEGGRAEPLARFLNLELDAFAHGEIWPTLIDFALHYGSQALSEHFSTVAARSFLDRWRVYQVHNRQFQAMIDIREAITLQNGNRWQEAADRLAAVPSRVTREWMVAATDELSRIEGRDEIALALSWLRQFAFETPSCARLREQIAHMLDNLLLTGRQRLCLEVWAAYVHKYLRDYSRSRAQLQKTMELASRLGALAPLAEERYFLADLLGNQRISEFLEASASVRQVLRRLGEAGVAGNPVGAASGLSRRETKILMMISEGGSNKFIANALGVSEATVKYHLGNVYRKLGCSKRREAIGVARAMGMVS